MRLLSLICDTLGIYYSRSCTSSPRVIQFLRENTSWPEPEATPLIRTNVQHPRLLEQHGHFKEVHTSLSE